MNDYELKFKQHSLDRMKERGINLKKEDITANYLRSMPYYTDKGCIKYLDWNNQVVYYVRLYDGSYNVETIIKTNPIQMIRNLCDAYRMLCENKYHTQNKCIHCNNWKFERICRDNLFGTCKRGDDCKYIHKKLSIKE
jgi:hypothetical protein